MPKNLVSGLVFVLVIGAYLVFGEGGLSTLFDASEPVAAASAIDGLVVQDVTVYDLDGRVAYRGDVDLAPELKRIEEGVSDPHENDGAVFGNREGRLPERPRGYYLEYVVRTKGVGHAGPQRLVLGEDGEAYYTYDHYESFVRVR